MGSALSEIKNLNEQYVSLSSQAAKLFRHLLHHFETPHSVVWISASIGQRPANVTYAAATGISTASTNTQTASTCPNVLTRPSALADENKTK